MTGGTTLTNVALIPDTDGTVMQNGKPSGYSFPDGLVRYRVNGVALGGVAQVRITYPTALPAGSKGYEVRADGFHECSPFSISGNTVLLTLADGGNGDSEGVTNGVILSTVGAASPAADSVAATSGGGGCSIGGKSNRSTAIADVAVILSPFLLVVGLIIFRRKRH
jgi:hypothetical protein